MRGVPLVHASALAPFGQFLGEIGAPIHRLFAQVGLPEDALAEPDALVPMHQIGVLTDRVARAEGLEHLGFLICQRMPVVGMGPFGRLVAGSSSLHEALHTAVRLHPAYASGGRLGLAVENQKVWLRHTQDRRLQLGWQWIEQFNVLLMIQLVRLTSHRNWRPREVQLRVPRGVGLDKIEALADARISFGHGSTSIEIPRALLGEPLAGNKLSARVREEVEQGLLRTAPAADFSGSVRQVVATLLRDGYPSVQRTSGAIGLSARTLQRRLGENGVSYSRIVEEERFRVAAELITQSRLRITDVAMELGYTDPTTFTHAFHRWTGLSPSQYRRHEVGTARRSAR